LELPLSSSHNRLSSPQPPKKLTHPKPNHPNQPLKVLHTIATKHSVSVANVAVRWVMDAEGGRLVHPIIGLRSVDHLEDNARVMRLRLDDGDRAAIDEVLTEAQGPAGDVYSFERSA